MADIRKIIGERIRQAREDLGWTQAELAEKLGKASSLISNYEAGRRTIRVTELPELANILQVPISSFFQELDYIDLATEFEPEEDALGELSDLREGLSLLAKEVDQLKSKLGNEAGHLETPQLITFTVERTTLDFVLENFIQKWSNELLDRRSRTSD